MKIIYNGNSLEIKENLSLSIFISELKLETKTIAAAVDEQIVPKKNWENFILKEGMNLDIFNLVAGG
ncbi:sulfur carrier protein [Succinivibrio dextrinosolvens]|uniref:sulfur carrier protein ThiS n=1 Tax=Succinivibrio dextrinosolvens TaxID=83771 RepID=UPI0008F25382|nr:sulfur carrier protein ThiS [Succinivibrio dextrinosolvens]SFS91183.1 sulfur carrier protein [Succinivibrio dextrinosolvens]